MFQRQGKKAFKKDLKNIKALCKFYGNPEREFKSIHIAGTNGKGSTAHILASLLQENGLRIGMYTSPHYKDFRERIKINGQLLDKTFVKRFVKQWKTDQYKMAVRPSFFELTVVMAFMYFKKEKLDFAIIETGLGGRLDSTNVISPELSIITNISYDHMAFLGNTLKKIAKEKAGIIKTGVPVVIGERQKETNDVFRSVARKKKSKISFAGKTISKGYLQTSDPFLGKNISTALQSYLVLAEMNKSLETESRFLEKAIQNFKSNSYYIGRWQQLFSNPDVYVDSAHNEAGLKQLFKYVQNLNYQNLWIVFGMVNDKDPTKVFSLLPKDAKYLVAKANIPRGKDAKVLQSELQRFGIESRAYSSVSKALSIAKRMASKGDLVLVTGSIFVVAEVV